MNETYYLKDHEKIVMIFEVTEKSSAFVEGICHTVCSWECKDDDLIVNETEYLADVQCKFDGCTHWHFRGEDYIPVHSDDYGNGYYHLCGEYNFVDHIRAMCFVWKLCYQLLEEARNGEAWSSIEEYYFENRVTVDLVNAMLDGYKIEKQG